MILSFTIEIKQGITTVISLLHWARLCITARGNILASGNILLKLFMARLETIELLNFWYVVAEHHFAQL